MCQINLIKVVKTPVIHTSLQIMKPPPQDLALRDSEYSLMNRQILQQILTPPLMTLVNLVFC